MKPKILYVVPSVGRGGAETFLLHTACFHEHFEPVYACLSRGPLVGDLEALGRRVHVATRPTRLSRPWSVGRTVRWLHKLARQERVVMVHSTMAYGALLGGPAARLARRPHCWFQHGPVSGWQDWLAGKIPSAEVFVNSRYTQKMQAALGAQTFSPLRLGVRREEIPGSPEEIRRELRQELGVDFLSAMICRVQPQKGVELWIEAMDRLRQGGINAGGLLIGAAPEPSVYETKLKEIAQSRKVPLLWRAATAQPWALARGADAIVCASVAPEGYGLTIAEAQAYGVPAVAPAEGGPLDLIRHEETGLFFHPRDAADLAHQLARLAREPVLAAKLRRGALAFAALELSAAASIAQLEKSYSVRLENR